jgi:hypothetical protein
MTNRQIAALVCRLYALMAFIQSVGSMITVLGSLHYYLRMAGGVSLLISSGGFAVTSILIATLLWTYADPLAAYMAKEETRLNMDISILQLQSVAFSVVGLLLLVGSLSDLAKIVGNVVQAQWAAERWPGGSYPPSLQISKDMIPTGVDFVLKVAGGLFLMLRSSKLSGWVNSFGGRA